ncbi:ThuA domain-containing protein [Rhodanobacter caeni]|uniref:ThuA-like domain-containing protein n=1 Tax=Rhodanobacter caeni TaxID=657654 RepID=A0ABN0UAX9_9GAMM
MHKTLILIASLAWATVLLPGCTAPVATKASKADTAATPTKTSRILVFTRTAGYRHESIPTGVQALRKLAQAEGVAVTDSDDPALFDDANLSRFDAVVFLSTTGDVLDDTQQAAFERYVAKGGGYMGVHAAADTEYDWPWYGRLVGAWFRSHPKGLQTTLVRFEGDATPLPREWQTTDELYNYRSNPRANVNVIAIVDESRYQGGTMGADHPIAWCSNRLGGRAWYTGLGHTDAQYADPVFRAHLLRGLRYVTGRADKC